MKLRTLGGLALEGSSLTRPKPLLLLTYLTVEGPKDRRHLSELFWPGAADPMTSLRMALSQLRRHAPGAVASDGSRLAANAEGDVARLLRALDRGALDEALDVYAGPFLDGFYLRECGVELEEWIYGTREFLADRVREALLRLAEADGAAGAHARATARAEAAWSLAGATEPDVRTLRRLYVLMAAGGSLRADEVLAEAEGYGAWTPPTPAEAREILAAEGDAGTGATRRPTNLTRPATSFVGRDPELVELARLLADPDTRLVTLTGAGGVGKTRLAVRAAQGELRDGAFADGVWFVALEALDAPELIAPQIASALSLQLPERDASADELVRALAGKSMLLVLDNFEHLLGGAGLVARLVAELPRTTVLVTSRERLGLPGEQTFPLEGFPIPRHDLTVGEARYQDTVQLFLQRARRLDLGFELSPSDLPDVLHICRLLDGLPLAIELAAAWVRVLSVREIAREIERSEDVIATGSTHVPVRHRSLRATFEHSWRLLSDREREALRRLSVFVGGFGREAAAAVAGASIPLLGALLDKSLLRRLEHGRFDRHPLLYRYTSEKLAERADEREQARAAHAAYYLAAAQEAEAGHRGADQVGWLDRLEAEQDNLRAALEWSLSGGAPETGLRLACALHHFWYYRSRLAEGERWLGRALAVAAGDPRWSSYRSGLLSAAGALANERGDDARAVRLFEERLALARAQGDPAGQAAALNSLGVVAWGRRDPARAEELLADSLRLRRESGDPRRVAVALNNLGLVALAQGKLPDARARLEESLALSHGAGDEMGIAMALGNLGTVAVEAGDAAEADRCLADALPRYRSLGDRTAIAQCLEGFAAVAVLRERHEVAGTLAGAAAAVRDEVGAVPAPEEAARHERALAAARAALGDAAFEAAYARGRRSSLDESLSSLQGTPSGAGRGADRDGRRG